MYKPEKASTSNVVPITVNKLSNAETLEAQFYDWMVKNEDLKGMRSEPRSSLIVYEWAGTHWQSFYENRGLELSSLWVRKYQPNEATYTTKKNLWNSAYIDMCADTTEESQLNPLNLIPTLNGYLSIKEGVIHVHPIDRKYNMDYMLRTTLANPINEDGTYTPSPVDSTSYFGRFLESSLPNLQVRGLVQELCAQTILNTNFQKAGWLMGKAGSGKSNIVNIVSAIHKNSVSLLLESLGDKFSLEPLIDASLCVVDEVDKIHSESMFKRLISLSNITIERKYQTTIGKFKPKAKFLICSNEPPKFREKSGAIERRVIFVPFTTVIPAEQRIEDLDKYIIENELHIVLDWMLEGAIRLLERGGFGVDLPEAVMDANKNVRLAGDSVLAWIETYDVGCVLGEKKESKSLYEHYVAFCEEEGRTPLHQNNFITDLRSNKFSETFSSGRFERQGKKIPWCNVLINAPKPVERTPETIQAMKTLHDQPFNDVTEVF